jgi:DNA-binding transcriptional LysR family regulator
MGSATAWRFGGGKGRERTIAVRSRLAVNTAEAAVDAAVAGVGLTRVLSYQAQRAIADGALKVVLEAYEPAPLPVYLLHEAQGALPFKMRSFLDFAAPLLRARLAAAAL